MDVPQVGFDIDHLLTVQYDPDVEDTVGRGVMGADVEEHRLGIVGTTARCERVGVFTERHHLRLFLVVVVPERVTLPGLGQQDPPQIRMVIAGVPVWLSRARIASVTRSGSASDGAVSSGRASSRWLIVHIGCNPGGESILTAPPVGYS